MIQVKLFLIFLFFLNNVIGQNEAITVFHFSNESELLNKPYVNFQIDSLSNENLLNKVTIINFWYEECAPCIAEMAGLNQLYEKFKNDSNFQFISFCINNEDQIDINKEKLNIKYNVYSITRKKAYELNYNNGFPTTIIIDKKGNIVFTCRGGPTDVKKATIKVLKIFGTKIEDELKK